MAFCEDCGAPLAPGVMFCENCGAKVNIDANKDNAASSANSANSANIVEKGIVYTNLKLLSQYLGKGIDEVSAIIDNFISSAAARGIGYELCDVSGKISGPGSVQAHIGIIRELVEKNHPKYLFILGSSKVVPSIVWENEASDNESDSDVSSDLPYSTLDTQSPFDGQSYDFENCLRTGRLPECDFENYFANLEAGCGKAGDTKSFGMSAEVWEEETKDIYKKISNGKIFTSPECTMETVQNVIPPNTNLLIFNLHGSSDTEYWYGQRDYSYPEALNHNSLNGILTPYFLMVEACYGAMYDGRSADESILLSALNGKCISFLGSSRIAFGASEPEGCCADVMAEEHIKNLKNNMSAGDSLCSTRKVLMEDDDGDGCTIKTLAEFSLYGDPSARMNGMPAAAKGLFAKDNSKSFAKGIHIPLPDVHRAVRMEIATVDLKIAEIVEGFVYSKHAELKGIKPKYFKSASSGKFTAVFADKCSIGSKIVIAGFAKNGKVENLFESK